MRSCRDLIVVTIAGCLALAGLSGLTGAAICQAQGGGLACAKLWEAAGPGALAAATTGGTLLAQLERPRRSEDLPPPPPGRPGDG